ncbi:hypothetical protein ACHAW5_002730 [Stephanodiscus triporus]|uniref:Calmodulin n=1 Tax=Stephanodiscus triporus TaxID=2934178 RepID=A0ABD3P3Y4_9STRA
MSPSRIAVAFLQRTSSHHSVGIHGAAMSALSSSIPANARTTFTVASPCRRRDQSSQKTTTTTTVAADFHTSHRAPFLTHHSDKHHVHDRQKQRRAPSPGSVAFGECEIAALSDLFLQFAKTRKDPDDAEPYLNLGRIRLLLESVGERPDDDTLRSLLADVDARGDGRLGLDCFLRAADRILGEAPARIVLVVGGPGSGKGELCRRLADECGAVHLSCGEMLREEVASRTPLGREVADIMARGDLVSSAVVTALMRRRMRRHPGRRILLDGFPRSLENARDFVELCGPPELALHLNCDDTVMIERIMSRANGGGGQGDAVEEEARSDDNVHTAIQRLKNYHKHHGPTMSWLKEIRVPIVELDCSGSKDDVWGQLTAIGRLMRPAVRLPVQQKRSSDVVARHRMAKPPMQEMVYGGVLLNKDDAEEDMQWIA